MRKVLSGDINCYTIDKISFVEVPLYDEFQPSNVIEQLKLNKKKKIWKMLTKMMPELNIKNEPKDLTFFYNILNTLD